MPRAASRRQAASNAIRPSTHDRREGAAARRPRRSRCAWQAAISSGVGLLSGGAQRTAAAMYASVNASPSSASLRRRDVGEAGACIARIRKSPEPIAVKTRPVRLAPCAAGARPSTSRRASGSPKPGTGRPQYDVAAVRGLLLDARSGRSRYAADHTRVQVTMAADERASRADHLRVRLRRPASARARDTSCGRADPTRRGRSPARARCASARRTRRACSSATIGRFASDGRRYWPIVTIWQPTARRSRSVATTSSHSSPRPTIRPVFVGMSGRVARASGRSSSSARS